MALRGSTGSWFQNSKQIKGLLLDISGVLYDGGIPIDGSIQAVQKIKEAGIPVRFCTNETQCTKEQIWTKLSSLGFNVEVNEIFPPAPATCIILKERDLRPHLLVHPDVLPEFESVDKSNPNCVVLGDATDAFSYANVNNAFRTLIALENPVLLSMGRGKYYKKKDGLTLDVGAYMKALEYACDVEAEIVGKPSRSFFLTAVQDMNLQPAEVMMIGDDIVNDVGGAQACGLKGVQVRTGKFRPTDEPHAVVKPDGYVDNLAQAIDLYIEYK